MPQQPLKRHRVTFQQNTPTPNAAGQPLPTWSHFATVYGSIEAKAGDEQIKPAGLQRRATVSHIIKIRSTPKTRQITPKHRATWNGKTFEIESATEPEHAHDDIVIEATEVVA